jgi:Flp pilus assembly protein TadB
MNEFVDIILSNYILMAISAVILISLLFFVIFATKNLNLSVIQFMFSKGVNNIRNMYKGQKLADNLKMATRTLNIKLTWIETMEIRYVDKPLLRQLVPFANIYVVFVANLILFLIGFWITYMKTYHIGFGIVFGVILSSFLFVLLDLRTKYLCEHIRNMMATWVSTLNKASDTKEDVIYILESSIETAQEPLKSYIFECVVQMKNGMNSYDALDFLRKKIDSEQFKDFIMNLKQNVKHRGNIKKLIANCEEEFFTLQEEYERRKITTFSSRIRIYIMMVFVLAVGYFLIQLNPSVKEYYFNNPIGKWVMTGFLAVYFIAFVISTKITNFNY